MRLKGDIMNRLGFFLGHIQQLPQAVFLIKTFESNNEKEIEIKSEKKQKVEKWHVYLDSNTGHLRKWKDTN